MEAYFLTRQKTTVTVRLNGPYKIEGDIELVDAQGNSIPIEGGDVVLCRCGHSANKPFCDGKHRNLPDGWDGNG